MKFDEIIRTGLESGKSFAEINAELAAAGATFHLSEEKSGKGWTEEEMAQGFVEGEEPVELPARPDMGRKPGLAGQIVRQRTKAGRYDVYYDEDGYATKAIAVK